MSNAEYNTIIKCYPSSTIFTLYFPSSSSLSSYHFIENVSEIPFETIHHFTPIGYSHIINKTWGMTAKHAKRLWEIYQEVTGDKIENPNPFQVILFFIEFISLLNSYL